MPWSAVCRRSPRQLKLKGFAGAQPARLLDGQTYAASLRLVCAPGNEAVSRHRSESAV